MAANRYHAGVVVLVLLLFCTLERCAELSFQRTGNGNDITLRCASGDTFSTPISNANFFVRAPDSSRRPVQNFTRGQGQRNYEIMFTLKPETEGSFSCQNPTTKELSEELLLAAYPGPGRSPQIQYVYILTGETAQLNCSVQPGRARTLYSVEWSRNRERIVDSTFSLLVPVRNLSQNRTVYRCTVAVRGCYSCASRFVNGDPILLLVSDMPPMFNKQPQDTVVFATDAAGNISSLTLNCIASGNPSPNITWFREGMPLSNEMVDSNGTLLIVNIREGVDAKREGVSYHCTATNSFGTNRSRAANVSYAYFDGFNGPNGTVMVMVTTDDGGDDVALECNVRDANPPPQIRWRDGNGNLLTEVMTNNLLRFLDNGRYLLIRGLTDAQVNTNYQCEVINARLHNTVRSPTTYDLVPNLGDEYMIYKELINRTVLLGESVEISYIAGAGAGSRPLVLKDCSRSSSIFTLSLVPGAGGVIEETIPRPGEPIIAVADRVTFQVSCTLLSGGNTNSSQATLTVHAPPVITRMPSFDLERLIGQSVTFTCEISSGIPTPIVTWYFNGAQPSADGVISISGNSPTVSVLFISSLALEHTGIYQCFASNVVGRTQASWALQVRTPDPAFILNLPEPMNYSEGDHFVLECSFIGTPPPTVDWRKDGSVFLLEEGRSIINSTGRSQLEINSLLLSDTGEYSCSVMNIGGIHTRRVRLDVRAKPTVSMSSSDFLTTDPVIGKPLLVASSVGEQVTLFAEVMADPCPTIRWRLNGSAVSSGADYTLNNPCSSAPAGTTSFNFTLTITAKSETIGTYTATLTNLNGTVKVPEVFVTPPVPVVITELWISSGPRCLLNETSVDFQCVNFGFPRPEIIFFQDTELITPGQGNFTRFTQVSYDTVRLTMIQQEDGGDYVCEARMGTSELSQSQPERLVFCTISQPGANLVTVLPAVLVPACTLLIVGAAIAVVCVMRRRQSVAIKSRDGVDMISVNREETGVSPDDQQSVDLVDMLPNSMIIPSGMLKFLGNIGQGEFGLVFKAHLKWHRTAETEIVAVKTMKALRTPNDINNLEEEVLKMKYFKHPNVMSLIGVCENFCGGPAVVMPFMANGSVLDYLKMERKSLVLDAEEGMSTVSQVQSVLLGMCLQIAKGMEYIADQKIVHRDLAARNCM